MDPLSTIMVVAKREVFDFDADNEKFNDVPELKFVKGEAKQLIKNERKRLRGMV